MCTANFLFNVYELGLLHGTATGSWHGLIGRSASD